MTNVPNFSPGVTLRTTPDGWQVTNSTVDPPAATTKSTPTNFLSSPDWDKYRAYMDLKFVAYADGSGGLLTVEIPDSEIPGDIVAAFETIKF